VRIDRPVLSATAVKVYAISVHRVFDTPGEACLVPEADETRLPPYLEPGDTAWTVDGAFVVAGVLGETVFSEGPLVGTEGAGSVVVVETAGGSVLLDAGMQLVDPSLAEPIGEELARLLVPLAGGGFSEAVLLPGPPDGHALPAIARHVAIGEIRATVDQYAEPGTRATIDAVQRSQVEYRTWLESSYRAGLESQRELWESTKPIAITAAERDRRWERHVEAEVAALLGRVPPPAVMLAEESGGVLTLTGGAAEPTATAPAGPVMDVPGIEWEQAPGELLLVRGAGGLYLLDSTGFLMRPVTSPRPAGPVTAPGLRPGGPTGPTPVAGRPATPWIAASAIGKSAQVLARTSSGTGVLVDAGGAQRFLPDQAIARMVTQLGIRAFDTILVTHGHADHVSLITQLVRDHSIRADRLVASASWASATTGPLARVITALRGTTDPALVALGYGRSWQPGIAIATSGLATATITVPGGTVQVYASGDAQAEFTRHAQRGGRIPAHVVDSASLMYVLGNETSRHKALVLGDLRGEDVLEMSRLMGPDGLGRALTGVRVIVGFGHHLGLDAGSTPADVRGYEMLFRETLLRNGELTIVVQSAEEFAFGTDPAARARGRALLDFATGMGARVVFAGEPGSSGSGAAVLSSDLSVQTHGTGVTLYQGEPRVVAALERLQMLREARRTVAADAEIGPRHLRLSRPAHEILTGLDAEVLRLSGLLDDLLGRRAADLLEARAEGTSAGTKADFRAERSRSGLTIDQIYENLGQRGPIETSLAPEVLTALRAAVRHGSTLVVEGELSSVPRAVTEAITSLPEPRRAALERLYREMRDAAATVPGEEVPGARRPELIMHAEGLRAELQAAAAELPAGAEQRRPLDAEVQRLQGVIDRLSEGLLKETATGRDVEGRLTRTEYRAFRAPDRVDTAFQRVGQVFGGLMVLHSVSGLAQTAADAASAPEVNVPETALRVVHDVHGMTIGVRMLRLTHVHPGEFVAMALLEVGAAFARDYATSEERDLQVLRTGIHSTVNLICMAAGMKVMGWGSRIPHPVGRGAAMGLGLAITMAGEPILRLANLDDDLVRWTSFPPGEVTRVYQDIGTVLNEYETVVGALRLAMRTEDELAALGASRPAEIRESATGAADVHAARARSLERDLMTRFEEAYGRAATSWVGLRSLDALAARFARLRHEAMTGDAERAELQSRFLALDAALDLNGMTGEQVRAMEQWSNLEASFGELDAALAADPDWTTIVEALDESQQMMDNARYRVESAPAGYRPSSMIRPGSPAYTAYTERLGTYEARLAGLLRRVAVLGGGTASAVDLTSPAYRALTGEAVDPRAAVGRLQALRTAYDARVAEAAAALPTLAAIETWSDSYTLGRRSEEAHRAHPDLFLRLRVTEMALTSAVGQARSAVTTAAGALDAALGSLVAREATSAERAVEERRTVHGIVLPHELDAELAVRRTAEDRLLAATVDSAYPRGRLAPRSGGEPVPLSDEEIRALSSSELSSFAGRMSSTEHQLGRAWEILAPMRALDLGNPSLDPAQMSRLERRLARITGPTYWTWDTEWIDEGIQHTLPADREPLVAVVGPSIFGTKGVLSFSYLYTHVIAINADAVAELGPDPVYVLHTDLRRMTDEELRSRATPVAP
jgi:hypothetical protein